MKWPRLKDIFAFQPPVDAASLLPADDDDFPSESEISDTPSDANEVRWQKIRFDNTIRLWVSIPTYLICAALWAGGAMADMIPMTVVFSAYVALELVSLTIFLNTKFTRAADYLLSGLDLVAMSFSIYYTGGVASPLYFIYFVPLIVHAFHRDWNIILFNGFGGIVLYGVAVLLSLSEVKAATLADLAARLVFMLLTVAIACLALNLLRRKDDIDRKRLVRIRAIAVLTHYLNRACATKDLGAVLAQISPLLASAIGGDRPTELRALLVADRLSLRLSGDLAGHAVPISASPAVTQQECVSAHPSDSGLECHWDATAMARFCAPIFISEAEVFGVLSVSSAELGAFSEEDQRFVRLLARSVALCAHRLQQMEELRHTVEMGSCVTAAFLASAHSTAATLVAIAEGALSLVEGDIATVFLWNKLTGRLEAVVSRGERAGDHAGLHVHSGEGIIGWTFEQHEPKWTSNLTEDPTFRERVNGPRSILAVPLQTIKGEVVGVLAISRVATKADFQDEEIAVASTFAHRAAHAIRSAEFREAALRRPGPPRAEAA